MTADEEQGEGSVSFRVYWAYFRAGSGVLAVAILAILAAAEAMSQYQQVMLCSWLLLSSLRCILAEDISIKIYKVDSRIDGFPATPSRVILTAAQAMSQKWLMLRAQSCASVIQSAL